ncbi:hypothetical protein [Dyadobacter crusticola]|uniref:hypothetical protein n=1 Tax=Dyadobacter crusticola TaxID=292407 RepID=UPI0004E142F1|nr:hypothetical protein [Dyadobacter crusticola]
MTKKSRKEDLISKITARPTELEIELLLPPDNDTDKDFEAIVREAIKLRETLSFLMDFDEL